MGTKKTDSETDNKVENYSTLWNPLNWDLREFICGWGSAFINICVTYPINKVTFRQMLHNLSPINAIKQISNEGIYVLYRGILPPLCQKTTSLSLMFGVYEGSRMPLQEMVSPMKAKALAALIAGTTEATLAPLKEDAAKEMLNKKNGNWYSKMFGEFICGGLIGGMISSFFYPLNVVKVHLQSKLGGEFQNIYSAVIQIYNERGRKVSSFYRGVHLNYTRGFISWGFYYFC
ncbi:mitochondrial carrier protein, putative [Pediculus humanus corporis]|uniref:Mitochondrial carrier protein, putative n=1 Tax=Pediculus humanus subsp. corporis TaxID=121224 RepID=E0VFU5_PEDHC|nr:mitochondrial carrier protein, putative [Pediculus humanus corporis]EEB12251.1 mitochondrial carrier protein, putative [Pediculus humanus corporis]